jgi:hypothetical protein
MMGKVVRDDRYDNAKTPNMGPSFVSSLWGLCSVY